MSEDDRLPILLVILDGLGDRASTTLDGLTPGEAAATPVLDELASRGMSGIHVPFGPGRSTSSEMAHWSLFGFGAVSFPGRAALEALGQGLDPPARVPLFHLALRTGIVRDGALFLGARARHGRDEADAATLFGALDKRDTGGVSFRLLPLRTGECVLIAHGAENREVSDTDALFDHIHPWMRPLALAEADDPAAAGRLAGALETWLRSGYEILRHHPVNEARRRRGLPVLDVPVTKWASLIDPAMPDFEAQTGFRGAAVTDTALYRGLASALRMTSVQIDYDPAAPAEDMRRRIDCAADLLGRAAFVHVHVKATDEAGHAKDPLRKREVIEALDAGLDGLLELSGRAVVAVTGDHATPSITSLLHSGDPTPFVVAGPGILADRVGFFGECHARRGSCGLLSADDILPYLCGLANRPFFRGHRPGARVTVALPDSPEPMPI